MTSFNLITPSKDSVSKYNHILRSWGLRLQHSNLVEGGGDTVQSITPTKGFTGFPVVGCLESWFRVRSKGRSGVVEARRAVCSPMSLILSFSGLVWSLPVQHSS